MTATDLPAHVQAALADALDGMKRPALALAAETMSRIYRDGGHSDQAVASPAAALAYAIARMPATYAAAIRVLSDVRTRAPDFAPRSLLDLGAGPGTAALAALAVWPSLRAVTLIEPNPHMRALAAEFLARDATHDSRTTEIIASAVEATTASNTADLVVMSYVLAEHPLDRAAALARLAARQSTAALVIIEPGRHAGFERILAARDAVATGTGMSILAPCPHADACPLPTPDWCHFSVRLARSRDHKLLKTADVPFEDEPYSYLALTRALAPAPSPPRVLRPPRVDKAGVTLRLCTAGGLVEHRLPRRNKAGYKAAKAAGWGETFDPSAYPPPEPHS